MKSAKPPIANGLPHDGQRTPRQTAGMNAGQQRPSSSATGPMMTLDQANESLSHLLNEARKGNPERLGRLLEHFRPLLSERADLLLGSTVQAKEAISDVVQNSLLEAFSGFSDFSGKTLGELHDWLACILEHRAVDLARRFRCSTRNVSRERPSAHELADRGSTPSARVEQAELLEKLVQELRSLPREEQRIIQLRYAEGASFEQIASQIGMPRETVRRTWYRLIRQLGDTMGTQSE